MTSPCYRNILGEKALACFLTALQNDLKQQMEILMDDMKGMEDTNRDLCEKMEYVQDLLNLEKKERDQVSSMRYYHGTSHFQFQGEIRSQYKEKNRLHFILLVSF